MNYAFYLHNHSIGVNRNDRFIPFTRFKFFHHKIVENYS